MRDERVQHGVVGRRPEGELAAREPARDEPATDTVVDDHLQTCSGAVAENVDSPIEWVDIETSATDATEAIQTVPEIDWGDADEDSEVRDELEHGLTGEETSR